MLKNVILRNFNIIANLSYQASLIFSQFILIVFLYLKNDVKSLDEFFYYLALLLPWYTFLGLGLRQLRLSKVLVKEQMHFIRLIAVTVFIFCAYFVIDDINNIFYMVVFWKLNDFVIDSLSVELQIEHDYKKLILLSVTRVLFFILYSIFMDYGESVFLPFSLAVLLVYLIYTFRVTSFLNITFIPVKSMLYLGFIASVSSLVVAYPRTILGQSTTIEPGVLTLISFLSYFYLVGQIAISTVIPIVLPRLAISNGIDFRNKLKYYLKFIFFSSVIFVFLLIFSAYLFEIIFELYKFNYVLVFLLLINLPFIFIVNFVEIFSSINHMEKMIFVSTCFAASASIILSQFIAESWSGVGYALIVLFSFVLRFSISYYFIYKGSYA